MVNKPWNGDTPEEEAFFEEYREVISSKEFRNVVSACLAAFMTALSSSQAFAKDVYRRGVTEGMAMGNNLSGSAVSGQAGGLEWSYFATYNAELAAAIVAKIVVDSVASDKLPFFKGLEKVLVTIVLIVGYFLTLGVDAAYDGQVDFNRALLAISMATQLITYYASPDQGTIEEKHFSLKGHILPQALVANISAALQCFFKL